MAGGHGVHAVNYAHAVRGKVMKTILLAGALFLAACTPPQPPQTPAQAMVQLRAGLGSAVAGFNIYAAQRPFCDQPAAKPPPLCADRHVVIEGDRVAHQVADGMDQADALIKATGARDAQWAEVAKVANLLAGFNVFVAQARGQ